MSGKDSDQIVVGANGAISLAPTGTVVAHDPNDPLTGAFQDLGYATPEGVTFTDTPNVTGIPAWQSAKDVRKLVNSRIDRVAFQLLQWNDDSFPLAFGGGEWVEEESGLFRFDPPGNEDALEEHTLVIDWEDGERKWRWAGYKVNVVEGISTNIVRTGAAVLPITVEVVTADSGDDWNIWTDDPSFDPEVS